MGINVTVFCFKSCQVSSSPTSALGWFKSLWRMKVLSNSGQNGPCVTAEPALTGLSLFLTRCWAAFSEMTDQNCKSCQNWSLHRGENFDLQFYLNQSLTPCPTPHAMEPKDWDMTRTWAPEPFQKQSVFCPEDLVRKPLAIFYHKQSNSQTLKLKSALPALLHTSLLPLTV